MKGCNVVQHALLIVCLTGFELMGFKPKSMIKQYFHIRPAQFIYPDEVVSFLANCLYENVFVFEKVRLTQKALVFA